MQLFALVFPIELLSCMPGRNLEQAKSNASLGMQNTVATGTDRSSKKYLSNSDRVTWW
jgi:hypothetical protein